MIKVNSLINLFKKNNSNFFTGVPDSVLKELSSSLKNKRALEADKKIIPIKEIINLIKND